MSRGIRLCVGKRFVIETEDALVYDNWMRYLGSAITGLLEEIGA